MASMFLNLWVFAEVGRTIREMEWSASCLRWADWAESVLMVRTFARFLIAEVLIIVLAICSFVLIKKLIVAGFIAGVFFVGLGIWIVWSGFRSKAIRYSGTFGIGCVHLFVIALPMMVTRFLNVSLDFTEVRILGLSGPVFHQVSTVVYFGLMLATSIDLIIAWRKAHRVAAKKSHK